MENRKITRIAMINEHAVPMLAKGTAQADGQNVYVKELACALSRRGIKVDIFTRWDNRKAAPNVKIAERAKIIRLKAGPRHYISRDKILPLMPEFMERFLEYCRVKKISYDVVHSHYYLSGWAGMQIKNIFKIPHINTFHSLGKIKELSTIGGSVSAERLDVEKKIIQSADGVIATSPAEKISALNDYKAKVDNVNVIPTGFSLKKFSRIEKNVARKKIGSKPDSFIVVFAGRMDENKGALTLVKAIKWIKTYHPKECDKIKVFIFSGDPRKTGKKDRAETALKKKIMNAISDYQLEDKIDLQPAIDQKILHRYYSAADCVVIPSYYEGMPLVCLEAMATGTPVIASRVGGLRWVIQNGINGFHARPGDEKSFGQKIVYLCKNPKVKERLAENSYILARQNYTWDIIADKIIQLYKKSLEKYPINQPKK